MSALISATIVAAEVKMPTGGQKSVSVKAADGTYFSYWAEGSNIRMEPGATYEIQYAEKPGNNGMVFRNIKAAKEVAREGGMKQVAAAAPSLPAPVAGTPSKSNGTYRPKTPEEERMIFITGLAGRMLGSGRFNPTQIPTIVLSAAHAWTVLQQYPEGKPAPPEPEYGDAYEGDLPEMRG